MKDVLFFSSGGGSALHWALENLQDAGISIVKSPEKSVTHLLLPVPSLESGDKVKGGCHLETVLSALPPHITVIGGNLCCPELAGYRVWDLLKDPAYISQNAAITANCALELAAEQLLVTFNRCPMLVIGWGRIGKCLAQKLKAAGADVTVAARKESDRAMLAALGYQAVNPAEMDALLGQYRVIFNTAPAPVISEQQSALCAPECLKMDLASVRGIAGNDVLWARGLPGKYAPESSGYLIAETVLRMLRQGGAAL